MRLPSENLMWVAVAILLALFCSTASFAQININVEYVNRSVIFLYGADATGHVDPNKPLGTGFIVQVPLVSDPTRGWKVLVTARHIADPQWAHCAVVTTKIFMRVNKKNFDHSKDVVGTADLPLEGSTVQGNSWVFSDDPEVDAAVIGDRRQDTR
jgi:hypothetical protein